MALTFINSAVISALSVGSLTCDKPTNTANGDIMFASTMSQGGYCSSVPAGWTLLCQNNTFYYHEVFYKIASSEGANYTFGVLVGKVVIVTLRGDFKTTSPIGVISNTAYTTSNTSVIAASMNILNNNSYVLYFGYSAGGVTFTPPTGFTELIDTNGNSRTNEIAISSVPYSQGATGTMTGTLNASTANKHAFAVSVNLINSDKFFQFF